MSEKPLSTQSAHSNGATKRAVNREQMNAWIEQLVTRRSVLAGATTLSLAASRGLSSAPATVKATSPQCLTEPPNH